MQFFDEIFGIVDFLLKTQKLKIWSILIDIEALKFVFFGDFFCFLSKKSNFWKFQVQNVIFGVFAYFCPKKIKKACPARFIHEGQTSFKYIQSVSCDPEPVV